MMENPKVCRFNFLKISLKDYSANELWEWSLNIAVFVNKYVFCLFCLSANYFIQIASKVELWDSKCSTISFFSDFSMSSFKSSGCLPQNFEKSCLLY